MIFYLPGTDRRMCELECIFVENMVKYSVEKFIISNIIFFHSNSSKCLLPLQKLKSIYCLGRVHGDFSLLRDAKLTTNVPVVYMVR
jgi:hypothetical protein